MTRILRTMQILALILTIGVKPMRLDAPGQAFAEESLTGQCFPRALELLESQKPSRPDTFFFAAKHLAEPACGGADPREAVNLLSILIRDYGQSLYARTLRDVLQAQQDIEIEAATRDAALWAIALDVGEGREDGQSADQGADESAPNANTPLVERLKGLSSQDRLEAAISQWRRNGSAFNGLVLRRCLRAASEPTGARASYEMDCARAGYAVADQTPFENHAGDVLLFSNGLVQRAARRGDLDALHLGAQRHAHQNTPQGWSDAFQWLLRLEAAGGEPGDLRSVVREKLSREDQQSIRLLWSISQLLPPLPLIVRTPVEAD